MFERFKIKTALREEMIRLREQGLVSASSKVELIFFEAMFDAADVMRRQRLTARQAMVAMVTEVAVAGEADDFLAALREEEPDTFRDFQLLRDAVVARAEADPELRDFIRRPAGEESIAG